MTFGLIGHGFYLAVQEAWDTYSGELDLTIHRVLGLQQDPFPHQTFTSRSGKWENISLLRMFKGFKEVVNVKVVYTPKALEKYYHDY